MLSTMAVLGPILFIVYTNDIDKYIAGKVLKFANDTKVLIQSIHKRILINLDQIWCYKANGLMIG